MKSLFAICLSVHVALNAFAEATVSDVQVFSGYPWKEVAIGYTITGTAADADFVLLTATDQSANKTYTARTLTGAELTEGRHVMRWNPRAEGVEIATTNVVFSVSIVGFARMGVQLWENGPYWAECNVGATKPEEYGYYFWWGDTVGCKGNAQCGWTSVKDLTSFSFSEGNCPTYGKDNFQLKAEVYIDATGNLVAAHDAATAHLGAPWRMPTTAEFEALINNCTETWTQRNGVNGRLMTGRGAYASNSIFLPAVVGGSTSQYPRNLCGLYWSSTPASDYSTDAGTLNLYYYFQVGRSDRYDGQVVRPVR